MNKVAVPGVTLPRIIAVGVVAGTVATALECALWWFSGIPVAERLFRDARLTAALVVGQRALTEESVFGWHVLLIAATVHVALSIVYAGVLSAGVLRLRRLPAGLFGAVSGLLLYVINMYGFTILFPWFVVARDWITAAAHVAFGITAAGVYQRMK